MSFVAVPETDAAIPSRRSDLLEALRKSIHDDVVGLVKAAPGATSSAA
jgi:hypothetical protein